MLPVSIIWPKRQVMIVIYPKRGNRRLLWLICSSTLQALLWPWVYSISMAIVLVCADHCAGSLCPRWVRVKITVSVSNPTSETASRYEWNCFLLFGHWRKALVILVFRTIQLGSGPLVDLWSWSTLNRKIQGNTAALALPWKNNPKRRDLESPETPNLQCLTVDAHEIFWCYKALIFQ